jgi:hypothetical protein
MFVLARKVHYDMDIFPPKTNWTERTFIKSNPLSLHIHSIIKSLPYKSKEGGIVNAFLGTIVAVFFLICVVYFSIEPLHELCIADYVQDITRTAILRCEADGGLTKNTETLIRGQFNTYHLDPDNVTIECTKQGAESYPPVTTFGQDITLKVTYKYTYKSKAVVGFGLNDGNSHTVTISKTISTTAKN